MAGWEGEKLRVAAASTSLQIPVEGTMRVLHLVDEVTGYNMAAVPRYDRHDAVPGVQQW